MPLALCTIIVSIPLYGICALKILEGFKITNKKINFGIKSVKEIEWAAILPTGLFVEILLAFIANLGGLVRGGNFWFAKNIFIILSICTLLFSIVILIIGERKNKEKKGKVSINSNYIIGAVMCFLLLLALIAMGINAGVINEKDFTPEMAESFIREGSMHKINPLTGAEYVSGVPTRIKVLALPFLYACLCDLSGAGIIPFLNIFVRIMVVITSFSSFVWLGNAVIKDKFPQIVYAMIVLILMLATSGTYSLGGGLVTAPYSSMTIRNMIVIPFVFTCLMKRRYLGVILAVIVEIAISWTLMGLGMSLLITVLFLVTNLLYKKFGADNTSETGGTADE